MPSAKYHCEYCEKSFIDTPESRRRHNQGRNHQINVKMWYDSFKDPAEIAAEAFSHRFSSGVPSQASCISHWQPIVNSNAMDAPPPPPANNLVLQDLPPSLIPAPARDGVVER